MDSAVWLVILVTSAGALFVLWLVLLETSIRVPPGTLALLLRRGRATGRALGPGRHFVTPWSKFTMQLYPSRELALVSGGGEPVDPRVEHVDGPLTVRLTDRAMAEVSYTVRCQLDAGSLKSVHDRFGPEGIWPALRDSVRATLLAELEGSTTIADTFDRAALEERCTKPLGEALDGVGFVLRAFTLRQLDLGETGAVVQETVRAAAELEREEAIAEVRRARIANDVAMIDVLGEANTDSAFRYRQLEAWRDLLQRWNGAQPIPLPLTSPLSGLLWGALPDEAHAYDAVDQPGDEAGLPGQETASDAAGDFQ